MKDGLKMLARAICEFEGFVPEALLITYITIFIAALLIMREYFKTDLTRGELAANMNYAAWILCFSSLASYWFALVFASPVFFDTMYGLRSDYVVYLFRSVLVTCFLAYFIHIGSETRRGVFYTFEYYFVILSAMLGLSLMCIASNLVNLLLFMELYSISIYYLIHEKRSLGKTSEAAFKYFVVSSFSTAFFLFGAFLVYYSRGAIGYEALNLITVDSFGAACGYFFIVVSLLIKIGAGVFFFWVLDAYEGATYGVLMFLNLFVKPVFIMVIFKMLLFSNFLPLLELFKNVLFGSAIVGVLGAVLQTKIKRFLIFTSIYNVGFLSCFFWDPSTNMLAGFIFFFLVYTVNSFCLIGLLGLMRDESRNFRIVDLKDLSTVLPQNKPLALALIFFLLALSGLPPFSFFFAKYFLFVKFFSQMTFGYVAVLLLASAIATFYYIRLIRTILAAKRPSFFLSVDQQEILSLISFGIVSNILLFVSADTMMEVMNTIMLNVC